jgi:hypothetical protein
MKLLEELTVYHNADKRYIQLYHGDLSDIPPDEVVDVLVVSTYPNNYVPLPKTLIGALDRIGVSVAQLALDKAVDLRDDFSCWLSKEIDVPGIGFKRILCFEPLTP